MKINQLSLSITDGDLVEILSYASPFLADVRKLSARVIADRLTVAGEYHAIFLWLDFVAECSMEASGDIICAKLVDLKVHGVSAPGDLIENQVMAKLREILLDYPYISVGKDTINIDIAKLSGAYVDLAASLKRIRLLPGELILES